MRGNIASNFNLGTLAGRTLIGNLVADVVTETTWCTSARLTWSLDAVTKGADVGPIVVGIAHGDYTDSEIEAWLELTSGWDQSDLVSREIARRKIRIVGTFENVAEPTTWSALNDGKPITTKLGWMLSTGETLRLWAWNSGSSAFAMTDPEVKATGHANLWPTN